MSHSLPTQWTTRSLLEWMTSRFEEHAIESPRLISEMLLTHVIGGERIDLYAQINRKATDEERDLLRSFVKRTLEHEPVQYIVGKAWFNGIELDVNTSTLIPRTCTETIVDQCLEYSKNRKTQSIDFCPRIADIGTGSGCIAISIALNMSSCSITATDISEEALQLASKNSEQHGVKGDISFALGAGVSPLDGLELFDIICSNPPYIPDHEMIELDANVREWEPKIALEGGVDGLGVIKPLLRLAPQYLHSGGILLLEFASSTRDSIYELAQENTAFQDVTILRDTFGEDRFLRALKT